MSLSLCSSIRPLAIGALPFCRQLPPAGRWVKSLDLATFASASTVAVALLSAVALATLGGS